MMAVIRDTFHWLLEAGWFWLLALLPILLYQLRYWRYSEPLKKGEFSELVTGLLDPLGRKGAIARIRKPRSWEDFYHTALNGCGGGRCWW